MRKGVPEFAQRSKIMIVSRTEITERRIRRRETRPRRIRSTSASLPRGSNGHGSELVPLKDLPGILSVISGHPKGRSVVRGVRVSVALRCPTARFPGVFRSGSGLAPPRQSCATRGTMAYGASSRRFSRWPSDGDESGGHPPRQFPALATDSRLGRNADRAPSRLAGRRDSGRRACCSAFIPG